MSGVPPSGRPPRLSSWAVLTTTLAVCVPLAVGGCSVDVQLVPAPVPGSGPAVDKDALGRGLVDVIAQKAGQRPDLVNCPSDLPRAVGATVSCEIVKAGHRVGTVTVTLTDGTHATYRFDMDVSTPPPAAPGPGN